MLAPASVAPTIMRARVMLTSREWTSLYEEREQHYRLHLAVPIFRFGIDRPEDLHVPLAAAPGLDHFRCDYIHQNLGEQAPFGIALEMVSGLIPPEIRVQEQRQEQIVSIVDDHELTARTLQGRVVDQVLLGAVRADVPLQSELARDDFFDRDLFVPALAAVFLFAARLRHFFGAAQRAPRLCDRLSGHAVNLPFTIGN